MPIWSLFQDVFVTISDKHVEGGQYCYPYIAYPYDAYPSVGIELR